jgi:hypothetical protein
MALGRFGWSVISNVLGRKQTYALFGAGMPIVVMAPHLCHAVVDLASVGGDVLPYLTMFYNESVLAITFYGGKCGALLKGGNAHPLVSLLRMYFSSLRSQSIFFRSSCGPFLGIFSILPAYIANLFGQKHADAIHVKALTKWAASAVVGPMGLAYLRTRSHNCAIRTCHQ